MSRNALPVDLKLLHKNYLDGTWEIPNYATSGSAGFDIRAAINNTIHIPAFKTMFIPTGLAFWVRDHNYALIFLPRSGKGCKGGLVLGNTVPLIDPDYQGEVMLCVYNRTEDLIAIQPGDHIAQGLIIETTMAQFNVVEEFNEFTERGANGFGHSRN